MSLGTWTFSSWQILPHAHPSFNSTTGGQSAKLPRAYQTNLFNSFPVQSRSSWGNTKQPWKTTSFFRKTSRPLLSSKNVPQLWVFTSICAQPGCYRGHGCILERCLCQGQARPPTCRSCKHFSCHRRSTKWPTWGQEAATQPCIVTRVPGPALPAPSRPGTASEAFVQSRHGCWGSPCAAIWGKGLFDLWDGRKK